MSELSEFRAAKDEFLRHGQHSPIDDPDFAGLAYLPENPHLRFRLPVADEVSGEITIDTSDGQTRTYRRAGRVSFSVDGVDASLTLFAGQGDGYFVPFRDVTSGQLTYGAGRYLDIEPEPDGTVVLDFNYAYNPYCAYNEAYSCPLPPTENWLHVPIMAGETHGEG